MHRLACSGDGVVPIWDGRRFQQPLLTFTEKDAAADGGRPRSSSVFTTIEYSNTRRGTVAALEKDTACVRFWDVLHAQSRETSSDGEQSRDSSRAQRRSWANLLWSGIGASQISPGVALQLGLLRYSKIKYFDRQSDSFALVPNANPYPSTSIMTVNKEGDLELYPVHDIPKPACPWRPRHRRQPILPNLPQIHQKDP